jgi:hypothetical protein
MLNSDRFSTLVVNYIWGEDPDGSAPRLPAPSVSCFIGSCSEESYTASTGAPPVTWGTPVPGAWFYYSKKTPKNLVLSAQNFRLLEEFSSVGLKTRPLSRSKW